MEKPENDNVTLYHRNHTGEVKQLPDYLSYLKCYSRCIHKQLTKYCSRYICESSELAGLIVKRRKKN